jgi:hypothetical protein
MKLIIMKFSRLNRTSFLLGYNILTNTLFSDTLNLCYSFGVRDLVLRPYKTVLPTVVLYIL